MRSAKNLCWSSASALVAALAWFIVPASGLNAANSSAVEKAQFLSRITQLTVQPSSVRLAGPRSMQQMIVTGRCANGSVRDVTPFCEMHSAAPAVAAVADGGLLQACSNGATTLTIRAGSQTVTVPVTVSGCESPPLVSFRHDVMAALGVGGCNSGACHGTPSGKNGFRLSLRGYDPEADFYQLTHDVLGRRTNRNNPAASLIYLKALGHIPHGGGSRFTADSVAARTLLAWLSEGLQEDPQDLPTVQHLEILPGSRVLAAPACWQQVAVLAHFSDGRVRDVTRLTVFETSDRDVASVSPEGLVQFHKAGEVAVLCRYLLTMDSVRLAYLEPKAGFVWSNPPRQNYIDDHVFAKLKMLSIQPSELCSDTEFIRRAYLDICGILPSPQEVRDYLADPNSDKRAKLAERLLNRPEYADFWTLKWLDVLRSTRSKLGLEGARAYQQWLRGHIEKNTPFDQVVRELLTADGNTFKNGAANYYRVTHDPTELAETTAQVFFGIRMQCARCHNHPFERWTQDDYYSTAAFFARVKGKSASGNRKKREGPKTAEIIFTETRGEVQHLRTGQTMPPRFLGEEAAVVGAATDRRAALAHWLTAKDNPFFARALVNRVWYHLVGRGIVDPVDDFRDSNPPANDALLEALSRDFVAHNFDVKHLVRTIVQSRTYQLSAATNPFNKDDNRYFSHAVTKLLTAEQMLDGICSVTEVPENFPELPKGTRAAQLPDGEVDHPFLKAFGQPARELACECERGTEASLSQALQLLNGDTVHRKVSASNNRLGRLLAENTSDGDIVTELYLATLSRLPCDRERQTALHYVQQASDKRKAWEDVQWALFNTKEFMFRH